MHAQDAILGQAERLRAARGRMARTVRQCVRAGGRSTLAAIIATPGGLALINRLHRHLTPTQRRQFHYRFGLDRHPVHGRWTTTFAGHPVVLPLSPDFPLAWPSATSFRGEDDHEVHEFYERLVRSPRRPRVFFDVGANYGFHSLKFLVAGVRTISFEPNPMCHRYLEACARLNRVACEIYALALGDGVGTTELWVPAERTYRASVVPDVVSALARERDLLRFVVERTTLDRFVAESGLTPDFVKIDTEGSELAVLRGAGDLLAAARPLVLFESWPGHRDRPAIFALLEAAGYTVVPLADGASDVALDAATFVASAANDFVASAG